MPCSKSYIIKREAVLFLFLGVYLASTFLESDNLSNIFGTLSAAAAAEALFFTYRKFDRTSKIRVSLLFYALACFTWGVADAIWTVMHFWGKETQGVPVLWVTYALTNCFLCVAFLVIVVNQFLKWDLVQSAVDVVVNIFLSVASFWVLFFNKDISMVADFIKMDFTSILCLLIDIVIGINLYTWFLSVRSGKIPSFMWIMSTGVILFTYTDIFYYYLDFRGLYSPNHLVDFSYLLSLSLIAAGALQKVCRHGSISEIDVVANTGRRGRWRYLLIYPFFAILLSALGLVPIRPTFGEYLTWTVSIFFYGASCRYIQLSIEKETLLKRNNALLEQRVDQQISELTFLTNQDILTALFNRRYFIDRLNDTLKNRESEDLTALLLIDIDRFKMINDTFGHDIGDKILIEYAYRMTQWNRYGALLARLGGDEFAIMVNGRYTKENVEEFCRQITELCGLPIVIGETTFSVTVSIGASIARAEDCDGRTLLQNADLAADRAQSQGYNGYLIFDPVMSKDFRKSLEIEYLLKNADVKKDFELFYQPQYSIPQKKLVGAEALIRWNTPEHGYIPPNIFIPIAEQGDAIHQIGRWVMREAISQAEKWNRNHALSLKIGFNVSPKQLEDPGFIGLLRTLVSETGAAPEWIDVEITESTMLSDEDKIRDIFAAFEKLRISVSIDDFGTGYSTLGCLGKYSFDRIKIDKSLVDEISERDGKHAHVVQAAINMAHASGMQAIAEGVERQEQLDILMELGCDQIQGYLFGRPVPADIFEQKYIKPSLSDKKPDKAQGRRNKPGVRGAYSGL